MSTTRRLAIHRSAPGLALLATLGALGVAGCGSASRTANGAAIAAAGTAARGTGAVTGSSTDTASPATTSARAKATGAGKISAGAVASRGATTTTEQGATPSATTGSQVARDPSPSAQDGGSKTTRHRANTGASGKTTGASGKAIGAAGKSTGAGAKAPVLAPAANVPGGGAPSAQTGVPYEVQTISMTPTYQPETKVYYDPARTHPQVGEVVIFYLPVGAKGAECGTVEAGGEACPIPLPGLTQEIAMKRVVGLPGDTIAIEHGHVIRNGQPEPEPPTVPCQVEGGCDFPKPITVPAGYYFVMADNRELPHEDSRVFGPIPQAAIIGTVEGS